MRAQPREPVGSLSSRRPAPAGGALWRRIKGEGSQSARFFLDRSCRSPFPPALPASDRTTAASVSLVSCACCLQDPRRRPPSPTPAAR